MKGQTGDILIFKAPSTSALSRCIAALTNSSVSHASIYYDTGKIVEMTASGIKKNAIEIGNEGDTAYFMRLETSPETQPILNSADKYLGLEVKYDYVSLFILCGLILNQEMRATHRWEKITDYILKLGCKQLDKLINHLIDKNHGTMMCSQLAYQCYIENGENYKIKFEDPVVKGTVNGNAETLMALVEETDMLEAVARTKVSYKNTKEAPLDKLAYELQRASTEEVSEELLASNNLAFKPNPEVVKIAKKFLDLANKFLEKMGSDLPVDALFVTPADLFEHSTNLKQVDEVKVKRVKR